MDIHACETKVPAKNYLGWMMIHSGEVFKTDGVFKNLHQKNASFSDTLFGEVNNNFIDIRNSLDDIEMSNLNKSLLAWAKLEPSKRTWLTKYLNELGFDIEVASKVSKIEKIYTGDGYDFVKIIINNASNDKEVNILQNILSSQSGSLKNEIFSEKDLGLTKTEVKNYLENKLISDFGATKGFAEKIVKDMYGDVLGHGIIYEASANLKSAYRVIKFGIPFGFIGGGLLFINSFIVGGIKYLAEKIGLSKMFKNEVVDILMGDSFKILSGEDRATAISLATHYGEGKTLFNRITDFIVNKTPFLSPKARAGIESILKGGIHTGFDMIMENSIKRESLIKALSKNGINLTNIDEFTRLIKEGKISNDSELIKRIRSDAHIFNSEFATSSRLAVLSRHRFSRRHLINTLQGYSITRANEMFYGIRKFIKSVKEGKITSLQDFINHVNVDNMELKGFLATAIMAIKVSYFIDKLTPNKDGEETNIGAYFAGVNDYMSSLETTFFARILTGGLKGFNNYYKYTDTTGKESNFINGVEVGGVMMLAETVKSLFREGAILKPLIDGAIAYKKTGSMDFANDVAGIAFTNMAQGLGKFMLLPGLEKYDLIGVPEPDDFMNILTLNADGVNTSIGEAMKLRNMADIDSYLNNKPQFLINLISYLPGLGSKSFTEAKYNGLIEKTKNDATMKKIWNGEFPIEMLEDPIFAKKLSLELSTFDWSKIPYKGLGLSEQDYDNNKLKEEVFVQNIAEKVFGSVENMHKQLIKTKDIGISKLILAAESDTPGSSRAIIGYLSGLDRIALSEKVYGTPYAKPQMKDDNSEHLINAAVVQKWYPYLYTADKTSWFNLAKKRMSDIDPKIYGELESDKNFTNYVNTLGLMDLAMRQQYNEGNMDAKYIKNIFALTAKYVPDEQSRIKLVQRSLGVIDSLPFSSDESLAAKVGVLAGNVDFYNKLKQDPVLNSLYQKEIGSFENIMWGTLDDINNIGSDALMHDQSGNTGYKKNYYTSKGYPYKSNKYSNGNAGTLAGLQNSATPYAPAYRTGSSGGYGNGTRFYSSPLPDFQVLEPKRYKTYAKIYNEAVQAKSENLTGIKGKQYPAEFVQGLKFTNPGYTKANISAAKPKSFKAPKRKYVSGVTNKSLPGG